MDPIPKLGEVLPSKVHIKLASTPRALCDKESNERLLILDFEKKKSILILMIMIPDFFSH